MKRFFACFTVLVASLVLAVGILLQIGNVCGTQGTLCRDIYVPHNGNFVVQAYDHVTPFAENRSFARHYTGTNCSPRSKFPTFTAGLDVPVPVPRGKETCLWFGCNPIMPDLVPARLYVLRV